MKVNRMEDISPRLLEDISKSYASYAEKNEVLKKLVEKINDGNANYEDLNMYAYELGMCLKKAFMDNVKEEILPDGKMYYNIAKSLLEPMCLNNYDDISVKCEAVQTLLNAKAGLGIKAIKPSYDSEKTTGIINYISNAKAYSQREASFLETLVTNSMAIVDTSVLLNANLHYEIGFNPKIIRRTTSRSCKWCNNLAGSYNYSDIKNGSDVFRRHANCRCTVVYDPGNSGKKVQDVWSKTWYSARRSNAIEQAINARLDSQKR